jgi:hypothetical protein
VTDKTARHLYLFYISFSSKCTCELHCCTCVVGIKFLDIIKCIVWIWYTSLGVVSRLGGQTTDESEFDSSQKQEVSVRTKATGLAVVFTQPLMQWVKECRSPGGKADGA